MSHSGGEPPKSQSKATAENWAILSRGWRALMLRTVPDFDRMTSDCVVAPRLS